MPSIPDHRRVTTMKFQLIEVEPLTPRIGAIIHGADLTRPLSDEMFSEIHDAWMDHLVLFFRNQPMTPDQHLAFGKRFGELHIRLPVNEPTSQL